jgi:O-antigen/teichoic acid export membrane protein
VYEREVKTTPGAILEAVSQTIGLLAAIAWLYVYPTIWALIGYGIVTSIVYTIVSYRVFKGEPPSFCWNREVVSEVFNFGKWILVSTALTYLGSQSDKLIVSSWMSTRELGLFSIAITFAKLTDAISGAISWKLLLPVYTELRREASGRIAKQVFKVELLLFIVCAPIILLLAIFGEVFIAFLYDDRYFGAGWMLQVMVVGTIFSTYNETLLAMVIAQTHSFKASVFQFFRVCMTITSLMIGGYFAGVVGLIYAIAIAPALFYLVLVSNMSKYNISPKVELFSIGFILSCVFLAWQSMGWPGINLMGNYE